ncbi:MAG: metallophosphoesterase family protein [bacterium]
MRNPNHNSVNAVKAFIVIAALLFVNNAGCAFAVDVNKTPDRIILNLTETPATSQAVTWRTTESVATPQGQIEVAVDTVDLGKDAVTATAVAEAVKSGNDTIAYSYSVVFKSLKPNTLYEYRVGDGVNWSEWSEFKTPGESFAPFKFVYFGDPQVDVKSSCSRIFRAAYAKAPDARFWSIVGDIVNSGDKDELWAELYYALGWIPRMTPMAFVPGNHEYVEDKGAKLVIKANKPIEAGVRKLNKLWRPQFTLPENGPKGLEETAYYIDYQGVRFVWLNGTEKLDEQSKWLDGILSKNQQRWTIVSIHQPFYSTGKDRDNPYNRQLFIPIFDKYSVDLVLQGHDHTYGRTYKLRDGKKVADNKKGTVYVVSVSGPKTYELSERYEGIMAKSGIGRQLFQVISVDKDLLRYESFTATGKLYDSFELKK